MSKASTGISVKNLSKDFEYYNKEEGFTGSLKNLFHKEMKVKRAVKSVSFEVEKGEMIGFIGPNGAGKTTTLKMLSGIICPSTGYISVNGFNPTERKKAFKKNISIVMGQKSQLWWDLPAIESLNFNACLYEIDTVEYKKRLGAMCEMLEVEKLLNIQVRRLSLGERMKIELIAALIHNPQVIFLDEPTIGLDSKSQKTVRDFLKRYNEQYQATITITSHYINDITELCQRSIVINEGSIIYDGKLAQVNDLVQSKKIIKLKFDQEIHSQSLSAFGEVLSLGKMEAVIEVEKECVVKTLQKILGEFIVIDFTMEDIPIEESIAVLCHKSTDNGARA